MTTQEKATESAATRAATWLGLFWVYAAALWLWWVFAAFGEGWLAGASLAGLRLVATLALGIGLCAAERWAWAWAVSLAALYALLTSGGLVAASLALWQSPADALSWTPILGPLNTRETSSLGLSCGGLLALSCLNLWVLTRTGERFNVARHRVFHVLQRWGLVPALSMLLVDGLLFSGWFLR
jgi:hypothetical protein